MKKITIMYDFWKELGGLERVMAFQANKLLRENNVEMLFSYVSEKEKEKVAKELGLDKRAGISQIGKFNSEFMQLMLSMLFPSRINNKKTDLIISHSFMCSRMAYTKKKHDGTKYIVMMHHPPNFLYSRNIRWANNIPRFFAYILGLIFGALLKRADKIAVKNADVVIVNSEYTRKRAREIYGIDPVVIYPPISKVFKPMDKTNAERITKRFRISGKFVLMHGRMIRDKRPDWAIEAFSKIKNEDLNLLFSGTIEEEKRIRALVNNLGLKERVKIIGRVSEEELVALYSSAECFIMPAPKEDFGLTSVEAMACGCPVVAWNDNAGPNETVVNGITGILAKPYDLDEMAKSIEYIIKSGLKQKNKAKIINSVRRFSEKDAGIRMLLLVRGISRKP